MPMSIKIIVRLKIVVKIKETLQKKLGKPNLDFKKEIHQKK